MFIHVTKCAGISIRLALAPIDNVHCCDLAGCLTQRHAGREYEYAIEHWIEPEWRFTVVRHPFSRFMSCWSAWNDRRPEGMTIDHAINVASQAYVESIGQYDLAGDYQFWLHTRPASWFRIAKAEIFRYESLPREWCKIQHRLKMRIELPRANVGNRIELDLLNKAQLDNLLKIYRKDFEMFGYEPW